MASTGAVIELNKPFWQSARAVFKIYLYFLGQKIRGFFRRSKTAQTIAFHPQTPGPWYNIWQVINLSKFNATSDLQAADYIFIFEDKTYSVYDKDFSKGLNAIQINQSVRDISKTYVAEVFEDVFGYSLSIDPLSYCGRAIMKSDANGTHDGAVLDFPIDKTEVSSNHVYQRLVDSTFDGETSEDLRVAYVLGEIALVHHKRKPLDDRFGTHYLSVDVKAASDVFSSEETGLIIAFCQKMGLDFGAVDVMRDKHDNQIYIVDVNKTCMPVLSLTLRKQIETQQIIADVFSRRLRERSA